MHLSPDVEYWANWRQRKAVNPFHNVSRIQKLAANTALRFHDGN